MNNDILNKSKLNMQLFEIYNLKIEMYQRSYLFEDIKILLRLLVYIRLTTLTIE